MTPSVIMMLLKDDVRADIYGDLYGLERVAEFLAQKYDSLREEITIKDARIAELEAQLAEVRQERDQYLDEIIHLENGESV